MWKFPIGVQLVGGGGEDVRSRVGYLESLCLLKLSASLTDIAHIATPLVQPLRWWRRMTVKDTYLEVVRFPFKHDIL